MTYFRTCGHYHRPRELNGRVRNGNECDLTRMVTGKQPPAAVKRPEVESTPIRKAAVLRTARRFAPSPDTPDGDATFRTDYKNGGNVKCHLGQLKFGGSEPVIQAMTSNQFLSIRQDRNQSGQAFVR